MSIFIVKKSIFHKIISCFAIFRHFFSWAENQCFKKIKKHISTFFAVHENKCVRKIFRFETKCDFFNRFSWKFTRWFMMVPEDLSYWRDWCWYHQTKCQKISLWAPSKFKSMESPGNKILILGCKEWIPRLQPRLKPDVILYRINSINH